MDSKIFDASAAGAQNQDDMLHVTARKQPFAKRISLNSAIGRFERWIQNPKSWTRVQLRARRKMDDCHQLSS